MSDLLRPPVCSSLQKSSPVPASSAHLQLRRTVLPILLAPCENLISVDLIRTRYSRHRRTRFQRLLHDLPAFFYAPITPSTTYLHECHSSCSWRMPHRARPN